MTIFLLISLWFAIIVGIVNLLAGNKAQESRAELYRVLDRHVRLHEMERLIEEEVREEFRQ